MIQKIFEKDYLPRLDNIIQWQERDVHQRESVSQHSYKVVVFTRVLLNETFGVPDTYEILQFKQACIDHAIFHDWDEALITRDLSHVMKYNEYNGEAIRKAVDDLSEHICSREFIDESDSPAGLFLYNSISHYDTDVHTFVKLADWLALYFFCIREIKFGHTAFINDEQYVRQGVVKARDAVLEMLSRKFRRGIVNEYHLINDINNIVSKYEK